MQLYKDFSPTGFDSKGSFLEDRGEWLVVPVGQTRDSGPLEQSNFEQSWEAIQQQDDGESCERHRFGHWGPGWFEIIIVRPGSLCAKEAEHIEASLSDYPVLDEEDFSRREWEAAEEAWQNFSTRDRVRAIQRYGDGGVFAARRDELPNDPTGSLLQYLVTP